MGKAEIVGPNKALSHAVHKKKSVTKLSVNAASLAACGRSRDTPSATDIRVVLVGTPLHNNDCQRTGSHQNCDWRDPERRRGDSPPSLPRRVMSISDSPPSLPRRLLSVSDSAGDFVQCAMRQRMSASAERHQAQDGSLKMHNAVFPSNDVPHYDVEPMAPPPRKALNPFLDLSRGGDKPPRRTVPGYLKVDQPPKLPLVRRARYHNNNGSVSGLSALTASIRLQSTGNVTAAVSANPTGSSRAS